MSTEYLLDIAQYCHRLFNRYCAILYNKFNGYRSLLSTAMEIAQLSRIQWKLLSIIHRMFNGFCTVLHTDYWIDCSI